MFDLDHWQEIITSISQHKLRTGLTAFGVFWGIFMLIILLGAGSGLENGARRNMGGMSSNAVFIWPQKTSKPYKGLQPGRRFNFNLKDRETILQQVSGIEYIAPRVELPSSTPSSRNGKTGTFNIEGDVPDFQFIRKPLIKKGRYLNELDLNERRKVAVIGKRVFDAFFEEDENPIGEYIKVKGAYLKIVGLIESQKGGEDAEEDESVIHIPITTAQQISNSGDAIHWFALTAYPDANVDLIESQIKILLAQKHQVHPEDKVAIGSFNLAKHFQKFEGAFTGIQLFTWLVGIGTMIAGIVGVSNIMLIAVKERTREFGLRKALGATPLSIIALVVQESITLTSIAGYIGLILGVGLVEGLNHLMLSFNVENDFFYNPEVNFSAAMSATLILVVTGALAGLIPAIHASSIKPIEALRAD